MLSNPAVLILALPSLALAVSLSDFTPRVSDLPPACNVLYTSQIPGCQPSDFTSNRGCSSSCVTGMQALVPAIQLACSNAGVTGNNPLNAFISGDGVHSLCPNAPAASSTTSTTSSTPTPTTTETPTPTTPTTTSTPETTSTTSTTEAKTSAVAATTSTSSSSSSSSSSTRAGAATTSQTSATRTGTSTVTSAAFGLGSSTTSTGTSTGSAAAAATSSSAGGNNSGGGSPFDTAGRSAASSMVLRYDHVIAGLCAALILLR